MIKLALDISTTATGIVIQEDNKLPLIDWTTILLDIKEYPDIKERLKLMSKKIIDYLKDKDFDLLIITQARTSRVIKEIAIIEGIILGEAIRRDIDIDYYPDVSWYSKIGNIKDKRDVKKQNSVKRFIERNNWDINFVKIQEHWSGKKEPTITKIELYYEHLYFSDDTTDAFNASDLYEERLRKYNQIQVSNELQEKINSISKKITKLNNKIKSEDKKLKNKIKEINKLLKLCTPKGDRMASIREKHSQEIEIKKLKMEIELKNLKEERENLIQERKENENE